MDYYEKLKDPRWQKLRLEILEENKWRCEGCDNEDKTLSVHHKTYTKNTEPWDYEKSNFLVLCEDCHKQWHDHEKRLKDVLVFNYPAFVGMNLRFLIGLNSTIDQIESAKRQQQKNIEHLYGLFDALIYEWHHVCMANEVKFIPLDRFTELLQLIHCKD